MVVKTLEECVIAEYHILFHDLLLRSYLYHCVWSVITVHISLQISLTIIIRPTLISPTSIVPPKQHPTYNWHLALLWVPVMHTLTHSSVRLIRLVYFYLCDA